MTAIDAYITEVEAAVSDLDASGSLVVLLDAYAQLGALAGKIATTKERLANVIANAMGDRDAPNSVVVAGVGVVRRAKNLGKHQLETGKEQLIADVKDSRIFDESTGELVDETPEQKILACWDHSIHGIRPAQMKARGLRWNDYAETIDKGWKLTIQKEGGA